jgi:hypothetical protein
MILLEGNQVVEDVSKNMLILKIATFDPSMLFQKSKYIKPSKMKIKTNLKASKHKHINLDI